MFASQKYSKSSKSSSAYLSIISPTPEILLGNSNMDSFDISVKISIWF